jgi:ankyrin repeat protein
MGAAPPPESNGIREIMLRSLIIFALSFILGPCLLHATPLHDAAAAGDVLQAGALIMDDPSSVNVRDKRGFTPLSMAAQKGNLDVVKLLVEKGAAVDAKANYVGSPASVSEFYADPQIVKLLTVKAPIEATGATPLYIAAKEGHVAVMTVLLDKGAAIDAKADDAGTPLTISALNGHAGAVELLLDRGAAVEGFSKGGATALVLAGQSGHASIVQMLLKKGAAVDAKDDDGFTPLARAVQHRDVESAMRLDVIKLLLANGADPGARGPTAHGAKTALELAEGQHDTAVGKLLRNAHAR